MKPLPWLSQRIQSRMSREGSPKKSSPPSASKARSARWIAPMLAAETLPYMVVNSARLSPTNCSMARRSFRSISSRPCSSATLKTMLRTPDWISVRPSRRPSRVGPISDTVTRTGWPFSPKISQKRVGKDWRLKSSPRPKRSMRAPRSQVSSPFWHMPDRSPLMSARKTGTPISEKLSAMTFIVTVLPVPVAPAIRPWRFAIFGSRYRFLSDCASQILLSMYI